LQATRSKRFEYVFEFQKECATILAEMHDAVRDMYLAHGSENQDTIPKIWFDLINKKDAILAKSSILFVYFDAKIVRSFRNSLLKIGSSSSRMLDDTTIDGTSSTCLALFSISNCLAILKFFAGTIGIDDIDQEALNIAEGIGLSDEDVISAIRLNREMSANRKPARQANLENQSA
jgi:hypothetical protein